MKRQLAQLSRDHHKALVVAKRLREARESTAGEARDGFLEYWREHGRRHFRLEEEILLPAYARHGDPAHADVVKVLVDHVVIRREADALGREQDPPLARVRELGERLAAHTRFEERQLFPLIEEALPPADLAELVDALERAERADR
jgi:hypothetical protein